MPSSPRNTVDISGASRSAARPLSGIVAMISFLLCPPADTVCWLVDSGARTVPQREANRNAGIITRYAETGHRPLKAARASVAMGIDTARQDGTRAVDSVSGGRGSPER